MYAKCETFDDFGKVFGRIRNIHRLNEAGVLDKDKAAAHFQVGSIEGRVGVQHLEEGQESKNFITFKCHRENNAFYSVNSINFHPVHHTFLQLVLMVLSVFGISTAKRDLRPCKGAINPFLAVLSTMMVPYLYTRHPKPSFGPHKSREYLPLIIILRNWLKYALTYREVISILMQRHVLVDGKVRTDKTYPSGFMDVISIPKTNENFLLLYDTKGGRYYRCLVLELW